MVAASQLTYLALAVVSSVCAVVLDQHVLAPSVAGARKNGLKRVVKELKKAEIIPTVLDDFTPTLNLTVSWSDEDASQLGNTLKPKDLQDAPRITISSNSPEVCNTWTSSNATYTLVTTDPDAPSRDDPRWSEFCHWIATGMVISHTTRVINRTRCRAIFRSKGLKEVMPYKPPGPPEKTGKHRYVFVLLTPANGTSEQLNLTKPQDRQNWGTGKERHGVRDWAAENGLVAVGANFIYAQNKKQ